MRAVDAVDRATEGATELTDVREDLLAEEEEELMPLTEKALGEGGRPVTDSRNCSANSLNPPERMQTLSKPFSKN